MRNLSIPTIVLACGLFACSEQISDNPEERQPLADRSSGSAPAMTQTGRDGGAVASDLPASLGQEYISVNIDNGRRLWDRCSTCHSFDGSQPPLPGPGLQNILGAEVGVQPGVTYSLALQEADFTWTTEHLDAWLAAPDDFLAGNAMSFAGISDPDDRRDLIACIALGQTCLDGGQ